MAEEKTILFIQALTEEQIADHIDELTAANNFLRGQLGKEDSVQLECYMKMKCDTCQDELRLPKNPNWNFMMQGKTQAHCKNCNKIFTTFNFPLNLMPDPPQNKHRGSHV